MRKAVKLFAFGVFLGLLGFGSIINQLRYYDGTGRMPPRWVEPVSLVGGACFLASPVFLLWGCILGVVNFLGKEIPLQEEPQRERGLEKE